MILRATTPSPLFIYAATLCRFVNDESGRLNPVKRLGLWLKQCGNGISQLSQLYLPILHQLLLIEEDREELLQIIGSITLLATPLPLQSLASFLGLDEDVVSHWLRNLHAVLERPTNPSFPIRLLHKSFSDFILGEEAEEFRVNAAKTHTLLASKCIQRMENVNGLREHICSLRETSKLTDEIDNATIALHFPPELEYACLYWVHHLQHSARQFGEEIPFSRIYKFFEAHFSHWLEALSLLGKLSHSFNILNSLQSLVTVRVVCHSCKSLQILACQDTDLTLLYSPTRIQNCFPLFMT